MPIVSLRPDGTSVNTFIVTGGASAHAVTADNSDASHIEAIYPGYSEARLNFGTYVLASTQFVRMARLRVRWTTVAPGAITLWYVRLLDAFGNVSTTDTYQFTASGAIQSTDGAWRLTAPDGQPWLQAEVDSIQVQIFPGLYTGNVQMPRIHELYLDLDVNSNPVAAVVLPVNGSTFTTSTRPPTVFSYSDPDNDQMEAYRVKVFSDDQYGAIGFDPNVSMALFDTGKVYVSAPPIAGVTPNVDLLDGHSYKSYVWVYQQLAGNGTVGNGISAPAISTYTIDIVAPPTPSIAAAADQPNNRVILTITPNDPAGAGKTLTIERSSDAGATWSYVRGGRSLANTVTPIIIHDYEMPPNTPVIYRARNLTTVGGSTIASSYSASSAPAVTIVTQEWWLKDPLDPTNNMILQVLGDHMDEDIPEDMAFFSPLGRTRKVSVTDVIKGTESVLTVDFTDEDEYAKFEALRDSQRVLLLVRGWTNKQWYIKFGPTYKHTIYNYTPIYQTVTVPWTEVDPAVTA